MDPRKIIKVLNSREDDSKRLDAILESMKNRNDLIDQTILYFPNGYFTYYDFEFKVFEAGHEKSDVNYFKDGREAIDYCLDPPSEISEIEPSENEEKNSDVGIAPTDERGIENTPQIDVVETAQKEQEKDN